MSFNATIWIGQVGDSPTANQLDFEKPTINGFHIHSPHIHIINQSINQSINLDVRPWPQQNIDAWWLWIISMSWPMVNPEYHPYFLCSLTTHSKSSLSLVETSLIMISRSCVCVCVHVLSMDSLA